MQMMASGQQLPPPGHMMPPSSGQMHPLGMGQPHVQNTSLGGGMGFPPQGSISPMMQLPPPGSSVPIPTSAGALPGQPAGVPFFRPPPGVAPPVFQQPPPFVPPTQQHANQ